MRRVDRPPPRPTGTASAALGRSGCQRIAIANMLPPAMTFARSLRTVLATTALGLAALGSVSSLTACGGPDTKHANVKPGPMPEDQEWAGVYFHPVYGYLHLNEEGANVVGRWKRADQSAWGELSGTKQGNLLRYTWKEHKIGMVGASSTVHGKGYFVYKMDAEGRPVLEGEYGLNDEDSGSDWRQMKQPRMQPDLKSIGGDAEGVPSSGF